MKFGKYKITIKFGELIMPALVIIVCSAYYFNVRDIRSPEVSLLLVDPLLIITTAISLFLFFAYAVKIVPDDSAAKQPAQDENKPGAREVLYKNRMKFIFLALLLVYILLIPYVNYIALTIIYLIGMIVILGARGWKLVIPISIATTLILYFVFSNLGVRF